MTHPATRDAALLFLRCVLGVVFIAHGWKYLFIIGMNGQAGTIARFGALGLPQPGFTAWVFVTVYLLGGAMLLTGLLAPAVATILAIFAALWGYYSGGSNGFFVADGGWEYSATLVAALLIILVFGSGRASLDRLLSRFG